MYLCCWTGWESKYTHMLYGTYVEVQRQLSEQALNFHPRAARTYACWVVSLAPQQRRCIINLVLLELERGWRNTFMACILNTGLRACCLLTRKSKALGLILFLKGICFCPFLCSEPALKVGRAIVCDHLTLPPISPYPGKYLLCKWLPNAIRWVNILIKKQVPIIFLIEKWAV